MIKVRLAFIGGDKDTIYDRSSRSYRKDIDLSIWRKAYNTIVDIPIIPQIGHYVYLPDFYEDWMLTEQEEVYLDGMEYYTINQITIHKTFIQLDLS